jgi:hypothetical protein
MTDFARCLNIIEDFSQQDAFSSKGVSRPSRRQLGVVQRHSQPIIVEAW